MIVPSVLCGIGNGRLLRKYPRTCLFSSRVSNNRFLITIASTTWSHVSSPTPHNNESLPTILIQCAPHTSHYDDVIMTTIASQTTSLTVVYSIVYSGVDQRKHQSSASLAFVQGIHRRPVNSPHKGPVTRKLFPFDDVIMAITFL